MQACYQLVAISDAVRIITEDRRAETLFGRLGRQCGAAVMICPDAQALQSADMTIVMNLRRGFSLPEKMGGVVAVGPETSEWINMEDCADAFCLTADFSEFQAELSDGVDGYELLTAMASTKGGNWAVWAAGHVSIAKWA